ncbi:MAG TPA: DUF5615 family PIN-like protein [Chloroflexota bacterium]|nr:DUF5615 family PIN-like protein [Chloroflexota bacterium]
MRLLFDQNRGAPPTVIWCRLGNCTTTQVEHALRRASDQIAAFEQDGSVALLELF